MLTDEQRARTLERFHQHRQAWQDNPILQVLYGDWYGRIRRELPAPALGPWWELGSGPGFARQFIPEMSLSDLVGAPWHDRELSADALPFGERQVGALVLFDVLHHLPEPTRFFDEAMRVLAIGGRAIMCEPYISPLSFPIYKYLHEESLTWRVDPFATGPGGGGHGDDGDKDPFDSNQAIPTLMFGSAAAQHRFANRYPRLSIVKVERLAGPSYPASGGFGRSAMLPHALVPQTLWRALFRAEARLPESVFRAIGFRFLVVLERRS